jgi:hypothetical protein
MKITHLFNSSDKLEAWGPGEWVEEADQADFEYKGTRCHVVRVVAQPSMQLGHFCGYIFVNQTHPWYLKDAFGPDIDVDIHGGLTFSKLEEKAWKIGFDCAHSGDIIPSMHSTMGETRKKLIEKHPWIPEKCPVFKESYKNLDFAINECKKLADQSLDALKPQSAL